MEEPSLTNRVRAPWVFRIPFPFPGSLMSTSLPAGVKEPSRTNGVVPEDMDVSPERKAPVQMLYDVDGPQVRRES